MKLAADDVQSVVIPGCGHYCQLSSGLDAQVRVPDPAGNAQKGVL